MKRHWFGLTLLACAVLACGWAHAQAAAPAAPAPAPPPADPNTVKQISVTVKIVEFQTSKGMETGLSGYFNQRNKTRTWGRASDQRVNFRSADITFPTNTNTGITVFLDQIHMDEGDIEAVLQGLVDMNRAFILSQPKAMVKVAETVPTKIQTVQKIPYENTVVIGASAVSTTAFRETGVSLQVTCPEVIDDDANWDTNEDTYIKLLVSAMVNEEGQRIVVALSNNAANGVFSQGSNQIQVPEFVSRSVGTSVWVRHGQVLLMGGLFRNTKDKNLSTLPWLTETEDLALGLAGKVVPGIAAIGNPISSVIGNRSMAEGRRELVFLIKAELWKRPPTVPTQFGETEIKGEEKKKKGFMEGISVIPQGIVEGIRGPDGSGIESSLGGGGN